MDEKTVQELNEILKRVEQQSEAKGVPVKVMGKTYAPKPMVERFKYLGSNFAKLTRSEKEEYEALVAQCGKFKFDIKPGWF